MLDDWPARLRFEGIASRITAGWHTKYYLKQLFKKSSLRIAIGKELCDAYKEKYGLEFIPFQNCPESELWIRNGKNNWQHRDSLGLIFTGAIYNPGNLQTLLQLSQAMGMLNRKGVNVKLNIYTTADNLSLYKEMFISEQDTEFFLLFPDQDKMAKLYGSADVLLLLLGFGKVDSIGEKYSMPTKLPAYMLSGTPIMACAPAGSALAKFIKNKNVGFLISKVENIEGLADDINRIYHNQVTYKEIGMNARAVALREFSAEVVRPRFVEALLLIR